MHICKARQRAAQLSARLDGLLAGPVFVLSAARCEYPGKLTLCSLPVLRRPAPGSLVSVLSSICTDKLPLGARRYEEATGALEVKSHPQSSRAFAAHSWPKLFHLAAIILVLLLKADIFCSARLIHSLLLRCGVEGGDRRPGVAPEQCGSAARTRPSKNHTRSSWGRLPSGGTLLTCFLCSTAKCFKTRLCMI